MRHRASDSVKDAEKGREIMRTTLNVGVIGVGWQGEGHVKHYQSFPNVHVAAIADLDKAKRRKMQAEYGVPSTYQDYREMLEKEDLDAVSVVTPDHLHLEPALAALESGKHVLMEKPLATNVEDAEAIVEASRRCKRKLMVNFSNRWMSYMAHTRNAIDAGELGYPVYAYARLSNTIYVPTQMLESWSSETALPFWLMSHTIDRIRWLFQSEITRVYAASHASVLTDQGIDSPDLFAALVDFENGAIGNFESCWILPNTKPSIVDSKMELIFSKGNISIDAQQTTIQKATEAGYAIPGTLQMDIYGQPVGFVTEAMRHFVTCVLKDKAPEPSGEDGLAVVRISAAIIESAQTGKPIALV